MSISWQDSFISSIEEFEFTNAQKSIHRQTIKLSSLKWLSLSEVLFQFSSTELLYFTWRKKSKRKSLISMYESVAEQFTATQSAPSNSAEKRMLKYAKGYEQIAKFRIIFLTAMGSSETPMFPYDYYRRMIKQIEFTATESTYVTFCIREQQLLEQLCRAQNAIDTFSLKDACLSLFAARKLLDELYQAKELSQFRQYLEWWQDFFIHTASTMRVVFYRVLKERDLRFYEPVENSDKEIYLQQMLFSFKSEYNPITIALLYHVSSNPAVQFHPSGYSCANLSDQQLSGILSFPVVFETSDGVAVDQMANIISIIFQHDSLQAWTSEVVFFYDRKVDLSYYIVTARRSFYLVTLFQGKAEQTRYSRKLKDIAMFISNDQTISDLIDIAAY